MLEHLRMAGLDHEQTPIALRERLAFPQGRMGEVCVAIRALEPAVEGCVLLSTCNRTELYLSCREGTSPDPAALLCQAAGVEYGEMAGLFSLRTGEGAAAHLMEVAGGLHSRIWGEDQILTQVKQAVALARQAACTGPVLETLFRMAVSAGKEVKTAIHLEHIPTSAAARAAQILAEEMGGLSGQRALVIGNGEMGRQAAELLRQGGCAVTVTLRSYRHGETRVPAGCGVIPYEARYKAMEGMDILLSATTSPHYTVTAEALSKLSRLPAWMVDLAIPRDIEPLAGELPGVTLYNIDTLGCAPKRDIPPQAEEILARHMAQFRQWLNYRACMPTLEALKGDITRRIRTTDDLEGLEPDQVVELAVGRAVDLLCGGLRENLSAPALARCGQIIRLHTRKEKGHGRVSLSSLR